jgi:hypothetical protein
MDAYANIQLGALCAADAMPAASSRAALLAPMLATPVLAISYAVPWAGVQMGSGSRSIQPSLKLPLALWSALHGSAVGRAAPRPRLTIRDRRQISFAIAQDYRNASQKGT